MFVQKQTCAGQSTRYKTFVALGDNNGHIGLDFKCSKEVAPVRRGFWGNKIGKPHTVPCRVTGASVRLISAPQGTAIVSAPVLKKWLTVASIAIYRFMIQLVPWAKGPTSYQKFADFLAQKPGTDQRHVEA